MSGAGGNEPVRAPGLVPLGEDQQGRSMFAMPYNESLAQDAVEKGLSRKTTGAPPTESGSDNTTPTPEAESSGTVTGAEGGGPILRFNEVFTDLGSVQLEALSLDGYEIATSTATVRNEMYRSHFPVISARFNVKCADGECGAEYDEDLDFCVECARREMMEQGHRSPPTDPEDIPEEYRDNPVRQPDLSQKRAAQRLAENINKEGQSLRELMKYTEDDQGRIGISVLITRKKYSVAEGDTPAYDRGDIIWEDVEEVVKGDPKRVVPVVDGNSRIGGYWWACPVHRDEQRVKAEDYHNGHRACDKCGATLREVYFAERDAVTKRGGSVEKVYFEDEVVTWARYFPRLHGLDGLSPTHLVWLKQAVLHWMDIYGSAFYDPESDRYPNKFMVVHTTNPKAWEKQFEKAEEDAKENPYSSQIMMNQYSSESNSTPEVQVIDLMSDEFLGQNAEMKKQYKSDIRGLWGVTDVMDSELEDAGGLNNEGLQLEVTDRSIATAMHDTVAGPLDDLSKRLGITDYRYEFLPEQSKDLDRLKEAVNVGKRATDAGLEAEMEDGEVDVKDGEFEVEETGEGEEGGGGGLASLFADFDDPGPISQKAEAGATRLEWDRPGYNVDTDRLEGQDGPEDEWEAFLDDLVDNGGAVVESMADGHRVYPDDPVAVDGGEFWLVGLTPDQTERVVRDHPAVRTPSALTDGADAAGEPGAETESTPEPAAPAESKSETAREHPLHRLVSKAGGDWGDMNTFEVLCPEEDREDFDAELLGVGVEFPESGVYVDWHRAAFPDALDHPHVSDYGSVADLQKATNNRVRMTDHREFDRDGERGEDERMPLTEGHSYGPLEGDKTCENSSGVATFEESEIHDGDCPICGDPVFAPGGTGNKSGGRDEEKLAAMRKLDEAFDHIVWADESNKAEPFWDEDDAVPKFVQEVIDSVIHDSVWSDFESLPEATKNEMVDILGENLKQPQGWSLGSISEDLATAFNVPRERAEVVARTETAKVLNEARETGYEQAGVIGEDAEDPALFVWVGPSDHRRTEACEWLSNATEGGVTYERLLELEKQAHEMFFDRLDFRKHVIHPNERHTFRETFAKSSEVPALAGDVKMEVDVPIGPALGTYKAAGAVT